jgi:hypothetical protein
MFSVGASIPKLIRALVRAVDNTSDRRVNADAFRLPGGVADK